MNQIESVPETWDEARDSAFFRVVLHLLDASVELWATTLLAANDGDLAST